MGFLFGSHEYMSYICLIKLKENIMAQKEIEWSYACTSNVIWGSFDYGRVWATSQYEAEKKAKEELENNLKAINEKLDGLATIEVNLDCLTVEKTSTL